MSNNGIFISQLASTIVFIIALFVLYRLLVEKKEATIQFLQAQLAEAKQPMLLMPRSRAFQTISRLWLE